MPWFMMICNRCSETAWIDEGTNGDLEIAHTVCEVCLVQVEEK